MLRTKRIDPTYKVPQDLICDVMRVLFENDIKHKILSVHPEDNICSVKIDYSGCVDTEPRQHIETVLEDYKLYMRDVIGDAIINKLDDNEEYND
jgi:hypothetical protein